MRYWRLLPVLFLVAGCGDDSTSPGPSAPRISNLQFSPPFAYVTDFTPAGISITGGFDFEDDNGDVALLRMTTSAGGDLTVPIEGAAGITRGTLSGSIDIPVSPVGDYGIQVWLEDATHLQSNVLTGTFGVRVDHSGTGWTSRPSGTTVQFNKVAQGAGGYFAVGYGGVVRRTADGLVWNPCNSPTTSVLWGAAWSGDLQVAVGEDGAICTSADGINWAKETSPGPLTTFYAVAWSGSIFAAVGYVGGAEPKQVLTSPDGATWTPAPAVAEVNEFRAVTWAGNRFVALGTGADDGTLVASSPDGSTWTIDARLGPFFPRDLCWSGELFVAAGGAGSVLISADGIDWEFVTTDSPGLTGVAWSGERFLAVGTGIYRSADGLQWEQVSQEQGLRSVIWAENRYLAVGGAGSIFTSP